MSPAEAAIAFLSLAAIVNPLAPAFAALTAGRPPAETRRIARRATLAGFAVVAAAGLAGHALLRALGAESALIHLIGGAALAVAGTAILFGAGDRGAAAARPRRDPTLIPLAVPLIAGPGALGTMIVLAARYAGQPRALVELNALLALVGLATWGAFRTAAPIARRLGPGGLRLAIRALGLVLIAAGADFLRQALVAYGVFGARAA